MRHIWASMIVLAAALLPAFSCRCPRPGDREWLEKAQKEHPPVVLCYGFDCLSEASGLMYEIFWDLSKSSIPRVICEDDDSLKKAVEFVSPDYLATCLANKDLTPAVWMSDLTTDQRQAVMGLMESSSCSKYESSDSDDWVVVGSKSKGGASSEPLLIFATELRFLFGARNTESRAIFRLEDSIQRTFEQVKRGFSRSEIGSTRLVVSSTSVREGEKVLRSGADLWAHTEMVNGEYVVYISPSVIRATFLLAANSAGLGRHISSVPGGGGKSVDNSDEEYRVLNETGEEAARIFLAFVGFFLAHELAHIELSKGVGMLESDEGRCDCKAWTALEVVGMPRRPEALECLLFVASTTSYGEQWVGGTYRADAAKRVEQISKFKVDVKSNSRKCI